MAGEVDPKEIILSNIPLLATYVVALAPIPLWFVLVGGGVKGATGPQADSFRAKELDLKRKKGKVDGFIRRMRSEDPDEMLYTQGHVDLFRKQGEDFVKQRKALAETVQRRDSELERWFEKFSGLGAKELPDANEFITHWKSQAIPQLVKDFEALVGGEEGVEPLVFKAEPNRKQLRSFQKRYWIQRAVLQAISDGTKSDGGARLTQAMQFSESPELPPDPQAGPALFETIGVRVDMTCSFRQIPRIVRELLAQPISMRVVEVDVSKAPFRYEDPATSFLVDGLGKVFTEPFYTAELPDHGDFKGDDKQEEYIPEPPIKVTLELEALDFSVEVPEEAPAAPPEQEE